MKVGDIVAENQSIELLGKKANILFAEIGPGRDIIARCYAFALCPSTALDEYTVRMYPHRH